MIPKVEGTFIEQGGKLYFRCKTSAIPQHDLIRIGFRLYSVGEYVAMIDAWEVTPFLAAITDRDWELLTDGD
jgi:hypothetical protein